mmetsp:Transcript_51034/g.56993  ORF Transcript_51034/g.56993 Transcript_51034/m.56993 type:complete len:202 (-) Transcript_51034:112-717(-)
MAMGYDTRYAYGSNAIHCDVPLILQDTPNTLVWAWDDWKKKQQNSLNPFTFGRPDDATLINNLAFPNWCLKGGTGSDAEERVSCNDAAKGEANGQINPKLFTPIYLTFKNSGGAPELGGYPTNTDIQYVYEFAAPFLGQAGGGTSDQCPEDFDGQRENVKKRGVENGTPSTMMDRMDPAIVRFSYKYRHYYEIHGFVYSYS